MVLINLNPQGCTKKETTTGWLKNDEGGICTALGLHGNEGHEKIIAAMKAFLVKSWETRQRAANSE